MSEFGRKTCQDEIEDLIEALIEKELLSGEVRDEVESLIEEGRYGEAARIATATRNRRHVIAK